VAISAIDTSDLRAAMGFIYTEVYAEPAYAWIGNILPEDGRMRLAAGAHNAEAPFVVAWSR